MFLYYLYRLVSFLLGPLIYFYIFLRILKKKEDKNRVWEKFGYHSKDKSKNDIIWIHAASIGEIVSTFPIIEEILKLYPQVDILITTVTMSSVRTVEAKFKGNPRIIHQYVPVDTICHVKRFLKYWNPKLAIWTESEFWPNLIVEVSKRAPIILVNGRISDRSFNKWQQYYSFINFIISKFTLILGQSIQDTNKLKILGATDCQHLGNLKYVSKPLDCNEEELAIVKKQIDGRPVFLSASTHKGEEEILIRIFKNLRKNYPNALMIIVPRHPDRAMEIKELDEAKSLNIAMRSKIQPITKDVDIYLADTIGELGLFYRLTPFSFIGGSLIAHGGQNPLEAVRLGCIPISGPNMQNFTAMVLDISKKNAMIVAQSERQLCEIISDFFVNPEKIAELKENAINFANEQNNILIDIMSVITPVIDRSLKIKDGHNANS